MKTTPVLTEEQARQYDEQGFLLVSGLIPPEVVEAAEAALWQEMQARSDDPDTWTSLPSGAVSYNAPELVACYTPQFLAAAAQLAGNEDPSTFLPPRKGYALNTFPQGGVWEWPSPHIDHAIKEHGHKTFPRAFRIATMTYLNAVESQGAATVVWPGSHKKIEALAKSDPARYEMMWVLGGDIRKVELGEPMEIIARGGDVLFYHCFCAHAGSRNVRNRPRLAMNMKW